LEGEQCTPLEEEVTQGRSIEFRTMFNWAGGAEVDQGTFYSREEGIMGWVEVCGLIEGANGGRETGNLGARLA